MGSNEIKGIEGQNGYFRKTVEFPGTKVDYSIYDNIDVKKVQTSNGNVTTIMDNGPEGIVNSIFWLFADYPKVTSTDNNETIIATGDGFNINAKDDVVLNGGWGTVSGNNVTANGQQNTVNAVKSDSTGYKNTINAKEAIVKGNKNVVKADKVAINGSDTTVIDPNHYSTAEEYDQSNGGYDKVSVDFSLSKLQQASESQLRDDPKLTGKISKNDIPGILSFARNNVTQESGSGTRLRLEPAPGSA